MYLCEHGCTLGRYKDMSNLRAHYRKQHGQKIACYVKSLQESVGRFIESVIQFNCLCMPWKIAENALYYRTTWSP